VKREWGKEGNRSCQGLGIMNRRFQESIVIESTLVNSVLKKGGQEGKRVGERI
jgi:hypothetical protein